MVLILSRIVTNIDSQSRKETVKKDILGNTIIEDDNGNKITIKKDILGKYYY